MNYTLEQGKKLVKAARYSIELFIRSPHFERKHIERTIEEMNAKEGVFVTIEHYPTRELRGCIGFPNPIGPLNSSVVEASIAAATEDPRFVPVSHVELEDIVVEVSVLSKMELVKGSTPESIKRKIKVGRDGLFLEYGYYSGLLLPIVAVQEHWNTEEFLENVCMKAGLARHMWRQSGIQLYKFTTQVFREKEPNGEVEEVLLG